MLAQKEKGQQNIESRGVMVGFDLGRYAVQISFFRAGMNGPEVAEQITGSEVFNIPMVLCKRAGVNQWFYGREAIRHHQKEGGTLVDNLLQKAIGNETVSIENSEIEAIALLTLFIKRSLSILGGPAGRGGITDIMFTCEELSDRVIEVMSAVVSSLQLRNCVISFQSYAESIYNYLINQEEELWKNPVVMSHYDGERVKNYVFRRNPRTVPIVAFVEECEEYEMEFPQIITENSKPAAYGRLDANYADYMSNFLGYDTYSSVYLLGDGFKDNWMDKSIKVLYHNRRLFVGNDIFSRGACYALQGKYDPCEAATKHVFLGNDKLRSNIGLNVLRRGEKSYLALLDAGLSWFEVSCEFELFLTEDFCLDFIVIPLDGSGQTERKVELIGHPDRDVDTLRVSLQMSMLNVNTVKVHVEDLGFGDIYPSSGMTWDEVIEL